MSNIYLKYQKPQIQFIVFMGLAVGFYYISILLFMFFFNDLTQFLQDKNTALTFEMIARLKWVKFLTAITSFLLPALLFGYFSSPKPFEYIGLRKKFSAVLLLLSMVLLFAVQPFIGWLGHINQAINFGGMQNTLKELEADNARTM